MERAFHFSWNAFSIERGYQAERSSCHASLERLRRLGSGDGCRGLVGHRAFVTGCIHRFNEIVVGFPAAHVVIGVSRVGYAGGNPLVSAVCGAAVDVIAGHGKVRLERRVPLQENAVRSPAGRYPKEHHADDPEKKDRQDRNRQAGCSSQVLLFDRLIHQRTGFRDASFHQVSLKFELLMRTQVDYGLKRQITG